MDLPQLRKDVYKALKGWYEAGEKTNPLDHLILFQQARHQGSGNARQAANQVLFEALKQLGATHTEEADLLRRHFLDGQVMGAIANKFNWSETTAYRKQKAAIKQLALVLHSMEKQAREEHRIALERRLDLPPSVRLIGVEEHLEQLSKALIEPEARWLISIEGLGGVGKTALANALIRHPKLGRRFQDIAWVSAKQQDFLLGFGVRKTGQPALDIGGLVDALLQQLGSAVSLLQSLSQKKAALNALLKKAPYLVVIDNLETVDDYQALLPTLQKLVNPSKVLLTSRHSLRTYSDVFCFYLQELKRADALYFIKYEADARGVRALAEVSNAQLAYIYQVVGGSPLAIKLVVGQIATLSLSQVLDNLKQARGKEIDELYTYIYWQAWNLLDPASQEVFLIMPLAQGGVIDQLLAVSGMALDDLNQSLQQLVNLSLVQVSDNLEERRYTIHRLTETFLLNEVIKWQPA